MADRQYSIAQEEMRRIRAGQLASLPYGILEVTANGVILNYFPLVCQLAGRAPQQPAGLNIFDDVLLGALLGELRPLLPRLAEGRAASERLLLTLPLSGQTARLAIVANAVADSPRVRISLVRLPDVQPSCLRKT
jgi:hypothetical protein